MIIIDDFIQDPDLLTRIDKDETFFGPNGNFMWWDGWWNSSSDTIKKELIEYIWRWNDPTQGYNIGGFEYWTGVYGPSKPNKDLGTHYDKDELLYKETGELVTPVIGTVFYPKNVEFEGGYLEIESGGEIERIKAKYNRLIIFPAGEYPHRVTHVTSGIRYAIAVNLWDKIPLAVKRGKMTIE
ncbi:2OG-Fe(II) oxygenase [bacterium]|nr:2OG-Fe(II) oxygenase [bacterium]MDB4489699.1 2OG-Fe(II) oxygenase [bacterium]